jgi:hypothetical protein
MAIRCPNCDSRDIDRLDVALVRCNKCQWVFDDMAFSDNLNEEIVSSSPTWKLLLIRGLIAACIFVILIIGLIILFE